MDKKHANKGVNFGGWLVLEQFLTPSLFAETSALDEYSLSSSGKSYQKRIENHHKTFITEKDFVWLSQHGIRLIRIPVGHWLFGDESPYVGSVKRLDWAFEMAKKYNLSIFLDVHGAKGGQNYAAHCGQKDRCEWTTNKAFQTHTHDFTLKLIKRYQKSPAFWGIELLNEPHFTKSDLWTYLKYYYKTIKAIRKIDKKVRIFISDWYMPYLGLIIAKVLRTGLDCHFYHSFGGKKPASKQKIYAKLYRTRRFIRVASFAVPLVIGEWSVVMGHAHRELSSDNLKKEWLRSYGQAQSRAYQPADAWCYFNYKSEGGGTWSLKEMITTKVL